MIHAKKTMLTMALAAGTALTANAQNNGSNSPYSRYGFGLLSDRAQGFNKGMSGLAYGMSNGKELNVKNPASYAAIDSLTFLFDVGISLQKTNFKQGSNSVNANNTSLDYLSLGFRATKNLGVSIGMMPFSNIGYNLSREEDFQNAVGTTITQTESYNGDGGLHEIYAGLGWSPCNRLALGFNAGYLWGSNKHTILASFSDATIASRRRQYNSHISTYKVNVGVQYNIPINKKNDLTLGAVYDLGHNIGSKADYYDQKIMSGNITNGDTLSVDKAFQLPHSFGVGATWNHDNRLRVGMDYTFQKWSEVKYPTLQTQSGGRPSYVATKGEFTDLHKVTVGMEYQHNANGIHWRDQVKYKAGFSYTTPYAKVDGVDGPRSYAASVGVALPIINPLNKRSVLNVSAHYERVEPQFAGMVKENYFRISIGLTFNEAWFMKWKVE